MLNFGFYIIGRNSSNLERAFKINIPEWQKLLSTVCPSFTGGSEGFDFDVDDVLTDEQVDILDKVTYDETAVSISEGYEELKEANFEAANLWLDIFSKIETEYFKIENEEFVHTIKESQNNDTEILKVIRQVRISQIHFDQIKQTLILAKENNLEVAFTISDY